ncbi:MAG: hypothetical protein PHR98_00095 [Candidatus Shapirobacteria bacterium]|jgi:hypothetical protein|nr:hypothetical protein [Candidatus Shapirobacteria bacterium]
MTNNNELVKHSPELVAESLEKVGTVCNRFNISDVTGEEDIIGIACDFDLLPGDTDRDGWINHMALSMVGYRKAFPQKVNEDILPDLQEQLASDFPRWGDTWKHDDTRPVAGQSERSKESLRRYFDQHRRAGADFPWMKVIGGNLINVVRLDHPEYIVHSK